MITGSTFALAIGLVLFAGSGRAATMFPHSFAAGFVCYDCHDLLSPGPTYMPNWTLHVPQHVDDTPFNTLCWSCHNDVVAPYAKTHSSRSTSEKYGDADGDGEPGWSVECVDCHDPHVQSQYRAFGADGYLAAGESSALGDDWLALGGANWDEDRFAGSLLLPNVLDPEPAYRVLRNTADTLHVSGPMNLSRAASGDSFAVIYGKSVRAEISTPGDGVRTVRFFGPAGEHSFADGDGEFDGVCEVCHTRTNHFRGGGDAPDQNHEAIGSRAGTDCIDCHGHRSGFAHGSGEGVTGCEDCHGHDDGYGGRSYCGTTQSHSTHTDGDADDARGVTLACADCHDTGAFPSFVSGTDADGDGRYDLAETDVCAACHSPAGTYDGVGDAAIGAKGNWVAGVYSGSGLQAGKERWCATCHDEAPATIGGVPAPNVVGDEDGASTYGIGWGYYSTGHGLSAAATYPASGGITAGAGSGCGDCHDLAAAHIDGAARTFDDDNSASTAPARYRQGYRLALVNGQEPLIVPLIAANSADNFRLCAGCHAAGPFLDGNDTGTNFTNGSTNLHRYHLGELSMASRFSADWDFAAYTSRITCVTCHNVHGSERLAMLRDGKLVGREPGLQYWYYNPDVSYISGFPPPQPEGLPLADSTGLAWVPGSALNLCSACHGGATVATETRSPFQSTVQAPILSWTGENGYGADGAHPDAATSGSAIAFRVSYTDTNNDPPAAIELWIDENDDGAYDPAEKYPLAPVDVTDTVFSNGKLYARELSVASAGDGTLSYRFAASDGSLAATGDATADRTITLLNNAPTLAWTGGRSFESDGVDPDSGGTGAVYRFRVRYTDADGTAPALIQVWIDANDDGDYEDPGEKIDLGVAAGEDGDYTTGEIFTASPTLAHAGDGVLNWRFHATDGSVDASGPPTAGGTVTVGVGANSPPSLSWASAACRPEGVKPPAGATGADYEFAVSYTDPEGQCPATPGGIQVVLGGIPYDLAPLDGDPDCSDGKGYGVTVNLAVAGDYAYRFAATDGADAAFGEPTREHTVRVVDALKVRPAGGAGWYSSIQAAANAVTDDVTILVYEGTYPGRVYLRGNDDNTIIRSVCGAGSTVIDGTGTNAVQFDSANHGSVIDGFQITNAIVGVFVNGAAPTIANCRIHGNANAGQGGGFYVTSASTLTVTGCEIHDNTAGSGAGLFLNGGTGHAISDTVIRNNTAVGSGGGAWINTPVSFTSVTIRDNTASDTMAATYGAGVFMNAGANAAFSRCVITGNSAPGTGNRGGAIYSAGTAVLENCVVAGNRGAQGGAAWVNAGTLTAVNSTIADNEATEGWGGAFFRNGGIVTIRNGILWGNRSSKSRLGHVAAGSGITVSDSLVANDGDGNFADYPYFHNGTPTIEGFAAEDDPLFVNPAAGNYHLRSNSPAIDRGDAASAPLDDLDGDPRPAGDGVDLGADEYMP